MTNNTLDHNEITYKEYFDSQGNRVREEYNNDELLEITKYNSKDEMVEVIIPGEIRTCYKYDDNGEEIEVNQYIISEDGVEERSFQGFKKYDEEGKIIEYEYDDLYDGHFHYTYKYQEFEGKTLQKMYDDSGELVEVALVIL